NAPVRQPGSTRRCSRPMSSVSQSTKTQAIQPRTRDAARFLGRGFETDRHDLWHTVVFLPVVGELLLELCTCCIGLLSLRRGLCQRGQETLMNILKAAVGHDQDHVCWLCR